MYCGQKDSPTEESLCIKCGGDLDADISTDEGAKTFLGRLKCDEYEEWFSPVRERLGEPNKVKWDGLSYIWKCFTIDEMFKDGILSWGNVRGQKHPMPDVKGKGVEIVS